MEDTPIYFERITRPKFNSLLKKNKNYLIKNADGSESIYINQLEGINSSFDSNNELFYLNYIYNGSKGYQRKQQNVDIGNIIDKHFIILGQVKNEKSANEYHVYYGISSGFFNSHDIEIVNNEPIIIHKKMYQNPHGDEEVVFYQFIDGNWEVIQDG